MARHLTAVGLSPAQVVRQAKFCLLVVKWFFSGISLFRPTQRLTLLKISEMILKAESNERTGQYFFFLVCVEVLRPSQQLRSCRAGQLPINIVPGQA